MRMKRSVVLDCQGLVGPARELDFILSFEEAADVLIMVAA